MSVRNGGNGLATRARTRTRASVEDLLEECDLAQERALERVRMNKHGDEFPEPDLHAYLKATELKAKLLGLLRNQPDDGASAAEQVWPRKPEKEKRS